MVESPTNQINKKRALCKFIAECELAGKPVKGRWQVGLIQPEKAGTLCSVLGLLHGEENCDGRLKTA